MDEIRSAVSRIYDVLAAWAEFGLLSLAMLIVIPYAILIVFFLMLLPFILIGVGLTSLWYAAIYSFLVMALVGGYCYRKYVNGGDPESPIAGRSITSENRAIRRSRSIMRNSSKRRR